MLNTNSLSDSGPWAWPPARHPPIAFSHYFSESEGHSIWKIDIHHQLTCLAGGGKAGYRDGTGTEARFNDPSEIDLDAAGNLYVADTGNDAIRKITPEGVVTTVYKAP